MECAGYKTNRNLKERTWELGTASPWPQLPEKSFLPFPGRFWNVPLPHTVVGLFPPGQRWKNLPSSFPIWKTQAKQLLPVASDEWNRGESINEGLVWDYLKSRGQSETGS